MRTLIWSKTFVKSLKRTLKRHPGLKEDIDDSLKLLVENPFAPQLETHKLKGKLADSWACSVGPEWRIVFDFVKREEQQGDDIFLLVVGTHDEVY
jgi:addiction module RelE/StbE family toxin